jgi:hypothetical protein
MSGILDLLEQHFSNQPNMAVDNPAQMAADTGTDPSNWTQASQNKYSTGQQVLGGLANAMGSSAATLAGTPQGAPLVNVKAQKAPVAPIAAMGGGTIASPQQAQAAMAPLNQPIPQTQGSARPSVQLTMPAAPSYQLGASPQMVYSDENLKTNIAPTNPDDIEHFLNTLSPKSFDYKDQANGSRTEAGLLAQDLQKSKLGQSVVVKQPNGLAVDTAKLSPLLATVLSYKTQQLENKINDALLGLKQKGKK